MVTLSQLRDARLALGWSRERLAGASNTTANFIKAYEEEGRIARINLRRLVFDGLEAVRTTLIEHGVEFDTETGTISLRHSARHDPAGEVAERAARATFDQTEAVRSN